MADFTSFTDELLVKLYAEGNNEAFDALLSRYEKRLYTYILCCRLEHESCSTVSKDRTSSTVCIINH